MLLIIFGFCYILYFIFYIEKQIFITNQAFITYIFVLNYLSHIRLHFFSKSHQVQKVALFFYIIIIVAIKGSTFFSNHTSCKKHCFFYIIAAIRNSAYFLSQTDHKSQHFFSIMLFLLTTLVVKDNALSLYYIS